MEFQVELRTSPGVRHGFVMVQPDTEPSAQRSQIARPNPLLAIQSHRAFPGLWQKQLAIVQRVRQHGFPKSVPIKSLIVRHDFAPHNPFFISGYTSGNSGAPAVSVEVRPWTWVVRQEYAFPGGLIRRCHPSTISPPSTVAIPTAQIESCPIAVSKSIATKSISTSPALNQTTQRQNPRRHYTSRHLPCNTLNAGNGHLASNSIGSLEKTSFWKLFRGKTNALGTAGP